MYMYREVNTRYSITAKLPTTLHTQIVFRRHDKQVNVSTCVLFN